MQYNHCERRTCIELRVPDGVREVSVLSFGLIRFRWWRNSFKDPTSIAYATLSCGEGEGHRAPRQRYYDTYESGAPMNARMRKAF